jgi:raffinose/stachyose/melibiose transport system permease protein
MSANVEATVRRIPQGRKKRSRWLRATPYLLLASVLYGVFLVYPMLDSVRLSFFRWSGYATEAQTFIGLRNYARLFTVDTVFWTALRNSLIWVVLSLAVPMVISLLLALALNQRLFGRNVFRSVFYLPAVFASITVAAMWRWIYAPAIGAVDQGLKAIGLGEWSQPWLGSPRIALYSVFVAAIWQGIGFNMVLFLAGLQQVPEELVDAALIDGANAWQRFKTVTAPALRPTTIVVVILTIINSLKVFDLIVGMTGGGPAQSTQVLALWSYSQSFSNHNFGMGGATATVLLALSLALVVPYLAWSMRGDDR